MNIDAKTKEFQEQLIQKLERIKWNFEKMKTEYEEQIKKYENALEAINEIVSESHQKDLFDTNKAITIPIVKDRTLKGKVREVLKKFDSPLTSRDIMGLVNNYFPEKRYSFGQFSAQFSMLYRRANSGIIKYEIDNAPPDRSSFYCLEEWYLKDANEDEYLKDDYIDKIYTRYDVK